MGWSLSCGVDEAQAGGEPARVDYKKKNFGRLIRKRVAITFFHAKIFTHLIHREKRHGWDNEECHLHFLFVDGFSPRRK
jgi:hypothetical protein